MVDTIEQAQAMVESICALPDNREGLTAMEANLQTGSLAEAIAARDTPWLYGWLVAVFSLQGISDAIALAYIDAHGNADWLTMKNELRTSKPACPKLQSFEAYGGCGYRKSARTCGEPDLLWSCPVPRLPLRKGDLNQLAASLFLFLEDVAQGDLVGFIDKTMTLARCGGSGGDPMDIDGQRTALMKAFQPIFGVGPKLVSMALADLLIAAGPAWPDWVEIGRSMIVIDSLVHNFLHRSGILLALGATHLFGPACYGRKGCEVVLRDIAARIDLSAIWPGQTAHHPRLIQSAIWRFCSASTGGACNGRAINDRAPCGSTTCPVGQTCGRIVLDPRPPRPVEEATPGASGQDQSEGDETANSLPNTRTSFEPEPQPPSPDADSISHGKGRLS